ncbi:hypothetical protein TNCV_1531941 [Trichonephila clavipes]|nr:hypothetical protein TNCV_1531941 [Trichonephila clavipes]
MNSCPVCHDSSPSTSEDLLRSEDDAREIYRSSKISSWRGVTVSRGGCQLRCHPSHLTTVHNCEEYCEDDALFILPAGLGPVKSRQDDLKYRKIREETNGMNFNKFFFRTSDCIENDTTMEDDSFRQESPVITSKEHFFP